MLIKDKSDKLWYGFLAVAVVLPFIPGGQTVADMIWQ